MERIVEVGQYKFYVKFRTEHNQKPMLYEIHAHSDLVLFNHSMPLLFENHEVIPLGTACMMTLDMNGKTTLEAAILEALQKVPRSSGILTIVS